MVNESVPKINRSELFERVHQVELDRILRKRALKAGLCEWCGNKVKETSGFEYTCTVCGRTYLVE